MCLGIERYWIKCVLFDLYDVESGLNSIINMLLDHWAQFKSVGETVLVTDSGESVLFR